MNWKLWMAQINGILRIELRRNLFSRRALAIYVLAAMPLAIFGLHAGAVATGYTMCRGKEDLMIFAGVFQLFTLRLAVFFGCVAVFMNLFRGEVIEKSLHYYFLAPVRREVLVAGKYLAGFIAASAVFGLSTLLSYTITLNHLATTQMRMLVPDAWGHLWAYVGVTVLACAGYGAVFLILGLLFRNPIIPTAAVLLWESIIVFMPAFLKKISVIFYLESLCPVRVPFGGPGAIFAITADPTPAYFAIPGLVLLVAVVIYLAATRIRRMEIRYGTE
jgi:ABC-type transport system involved in multi-copper enzyme maturation permease subunit